MNNFKLTTIYCTAEIFTGVTFTKPAKFLMM